MASGPLGKYSQAVAAVLATVIVITALILRVIAAILATEVSSPFVDNMALIALGAVFGASAATTVNGGAIQAAHRRLDEISAPPADYLQAKATE